jgi:hypothetical protein
MAMPLSQKNTMRFLFTLIFMLILCGATGAQITVKTEPQPPLQPLDGIRAVRAIFTVPPNKPPRDRGLPPPEFDHPYDGPLEIVITRADIPDIAAACPTIKVPPWSAMLGCSRITPTRCEVYIAHDDLLQAYRTTYDVTWRHERGHCNGWRHAQEYVDGTVLQPTPRDGTVRTLRVQPVLRWTDPPFVAKY